MGADYERIGEENRRRYGTETAHLDILKELYAQRTHFLYELLQNAEDAGASRVALELHADRIELRHDGRPFDERDVRGVCGVCMGTKANDFGQIGKFGIGFKSVYAYTRSPEIHSGAEHFRIAAYTQPLQVEPRSDLGPPWTTLQIFPFDGSKVRPERALNEIGQALRKLGMRTLIFLRNIREVEWEARGGTSGIIRRGSRSKAANPVRQVVVAEAIEGHSAEEEWLIFRRPVAVPAERTPSSARREIVDVEIAYLLAPGDGDSRRISRARGTALVVFFPTQRETHVGFLIQGPFRTTPARDNIREDDEWNDRLVGETAALVGDSLAELKRRGLLDLEVLEAMPIRAEDFPDGDVFRPIFEHVRDALAHRALIPAMGGKYIAGEHSKLCSIPELRHLLTPAILRQLFRSDSPLNWVEGDLSEDLRDYLAGELGIEEVTTDLFVQRFDEVFIARRTDAWVARFYAFLEGRRRLWEMGKILTPPLRRKPFIRLRDRTHVSPFDNDGYPRAWLPGPFQLDEFPTVRPEVIRGHKRAIGFLKGLGLSEPDVADEVLARVLPRYASQGVRVGPKQHARHLDLINLALKTDSESKRRRLVETLLETPFLRAVNTATGKRGFRSPGGVYERRDDLLHYFEGSPDTWILDEDLPIEPDIFFAEAILSGVGVVRHEAAGSGYIPLPDDEDGSHRRGVAGFDPDCDVEGLEIALTRIDPRKAEFIWNSVLVSLADQVRGEVDYSTGPYFVNARREGTLSRMGALVTTAAWLPSRSDPTRFHRPDELTLEDLPPGFVPDRALASALGMRASGVVKFAEENDIDVECLDLFLREFRENRAMMEKILKKMRKRSGALGDGNAGFAESITKTFARPSSPSDPDVPLPPGIVRNAERLLTRLMQDIEQRKTEATISRSERRLGPRRIPATKNPDIRAFLDAEYDGRCQICNATFLRRDGKPYFEAVYLVSVRHIGWIDHPGNVLCLCASCSAKFRHGSVEADDILDQMLAMRLIQEGGDGEPGIEIRLCGQTVRIRFSERHAVRVRAMLLAESRETSTAAARL